MVDSPNAPRLQLANELKALRERTGLSAHDVAARARCSADTIRRYERGDTGIRYGEFDLLLRILGVGPADDRRAVLEELREQGNQPLWYSRFHLPDVMHRMLGFESIAARIRLYEVTLVPGLVQTERYARAILPVFDMTDDIEHGLTLRMERQTRVLKSSTPPVLQVLLHEDVLRQPIGDDPSIMEEQLARLLHGVNVRILRRDSGLNRGALGQFHIFEFPEHLRRPAVYTDGPIRSLYIDNDEDVKRANLNYDHMWDLALGPEESRALIRGTMEALAT